MIAKLHYLTQDLGNISHTALAEDACAGGVKWIQLRVKNQSSVQWMMTAIHTLKICKAANAKLIINDNVDLAGLLNADGVHLGKTDKKPKEARKILGKQFIIGGTAHSFDDILDLAEQEVDYIGLGPYKFTETKKNLSEILGLKGYQQILEQCDIHKIRIPIIAIGGIALNDVAELVSIGMYGIAVSSAINLVQDRTEMTKKFIEAVG